MFAIFRKNKLDLSTPSSFSKSIEKSQGKLREIFSMETWKVITSKPNPRAYMEVIESHAELGNHECQELVAQWNCGVCEISTDKEHLKFCLRKAIKYGAMAAESGVTNEAINMPISLSQLLTILMDESGGNFTSEIKELIKDQYRWNIRNSKNPDIPESKRKSSAETASALYEAMPELFSDVIQFGEHSENVKTEQQIDIEGLEKDTYLVKVAEILDATMAPLMPLRNAYDLAVECLGELRENISKGMFRPGINPREDVMAYYCLCSMVRESGFSDDKAVVLQISFAARCLADKLHDQQTFTPLEKGICIFGKQTLNEYFPHQSKEDITRIKRKAADIVYEITNANGAPISLDESEALINNVSSTIHEIDVFKSGEVVLAILALANITAYSIDQGEIERANAFFTCVSATIEKYVKGQTMSEDQSRALRSVMSNYRSVVQELEEVNLKLG